MVKASEPYVLRTRQAASEQATLSTNFTRRSYSLIVLPARSLTTDGVTT